SRTKRSRRRRRRRASGRACSAATTRRTTRSRTTRTSNIREDTMSFRHITGHRPLLALLSRTSARGALPPSLIFSGPSGVGKRLTAVALAQTLNCTNPVEWDGGVDACGACLSCGRIARGVHADVLIVEPAESGSIKVDQVRDAIERAAYRPFEGRRRVVIIDEADALMPEAQNALLKTLEEPPPASVFVLVTSRQ